MDILVPISEISPEETLARVTAAFAPGTLAAKRAELAQLRERGDTLLFEGAVDWALILPGSDRHMSGYAQNLDDAFEDLIACLDQLAESEDGNIEVICAVSQTDDSESTP